uniref:DNA replication ATP-dependent helicase/nuclease DNA2 n=1 Tax=Myxine glutinosa TaxID=7769 RepID=UPI00358FB190
MPLRKSRTTASQAMGQGQLDIATFFPKKSGMVTSQPVLNTDKTVNILKTVTVLEDGGSSEISVTQSPPPSVGSLVSYHRNASAVKSVNKTELSIGQNCNRLSRSIITHSSLGSKHLGASQRGGGKLFLQNKKGGEPESKPSITTPEGPCTKKSRSDVPFVKRDTAVDHADLLLEDCLEAKSSMHLKNCAEVIAKADHALAKENSIRMKSILYSGNASNIFLKNPQKHGEEVVGGPDKQPSVDEDVWIPRPAKTWRPFDRSPKEVDDDGNFAIHMTPTAEDIGAEEHNHFIVEPLSSHGMSFEESHRSAHNCDSSKGEVLECASMKYNDAGLSPNKDGIGMSSLNMLLGMGKHTKATDLTFVDLDATLHDVGKSTKATDLAVEESFVDLDAETVVACQSRQEVPLDCINMEWHLSSTDTLKNLTTAEEDAMNSAFPDDLTEDLLAALEESSGLPDEEAQTKFTKPTMTGHSWDKKRQHMVLCEGSYNRYRVDAIKEVSISLWVMEKHLTLTTGLPDSLVRSCVLKDDWAETQVLCGDVVHVEPPEPRSRSSTTDFEISQDFGFVVLWPDILLSGTTVTRAIRCHRRAVLGELFKFEQGGDGGSSAMLLGTVLHEVFQNAAIRRDFSLTSLGQIALETLSRPQHLGDMYSLALSQEDITEDVLGYLPTVHRWAEEYLHPTPMPTQGYMQLQMPGKKDSPEKCNLAVCDITDIEESIWSPRFGLKGKLDVTAKVAVQRRGRGSALQENGAASWEAVLPLELKTGRESNSLEHRAQVILYTLLSQERRAEPGLGLLLYLKTGAVHAVPAQRLDLRELIKIRNKIANHLATPTERCPDTVEEVRPSSLPPIILDRDTCQRCSQLRNCALMHRAVEKGWSPEEMTEEQVVLLKQQIQHLSKAHLTYFAHWYLLCLLEGEATSSKNNRSELWALPAQTRELAGRCTRGLKCQGPAKQLSAGGRGFHQRMSRPKPTSMSLLTSGDRIVLSQDGGAGTLAVAMGTLLAVTDEFVDCLLDRDIARYGPGTTFCLDLDDNGNSMNSHLSSLSHLMADTQSSRRLRELIVDFSLPHFVERLLDVLPRGAKDSVAKILQGLNRPQRQAMKRVLLSKDYTLVVGMPGTGKTTTICSLVRILHACGFSVLLASFTHSAVDNVLLKLTRFQVPFLRLGRAEKVHEVLRSKTEEELCRARSISTLSQLTQLYNEQAVVATTCMGACRHPLFSRRRFDFCVVDEASQVSQLLCLAPLLHSERFVLVGDHLQLPPLVLSTKAKALGMDESLFKRLERHATAVVQLNVQYRMNREIMFLSNELTYEGHLICGSERVANGRLCLPRLPHLALDPGSWLKEALDPAKPVLFLDTDQVPAHELTERGNMRNPTEAALVTCIVAALVKAGCRATDIGVIAPYRQQLQAVSELTTGRDWARGLEINTVDKYQGRDKPAIIVSFVRSDVASHNQGGLLKDWRRLNVALTRAKFKLLLLGCAPALRNYAPIARLLDHADTHGLMVPLPSKAHTTYTYLME